MGILTLTLTLPYLIVPTKCNFDGDKEQFESIHRNLYDQTTIIKVSHICANCCVQDIHTMATRPIQIITCANYEKFGETTQSVFEGMASKIIFGHNIEALPDLSGLMLGFGIICKFMIFLAKTMDCGSRIHSTLKIYPWLHIVYDQNMRDNNTRRTIHLGRSFLLKLNHANLKCDRACG